MTDLFAILDAQINSATVQVIASRQEHALALAYGRGADENRAVVHAGIAAITAVPANPAPVTTVEFLVALAAMPTDEVEQEVQDLRIAIFANNRLKNQIGWRDYKKKIDRAIDSVKSARQAEKAAQAIVTVVAVDPDDHLALAEGFRESLLVDGFCTLVLHAGEWLRWDSHCYAPLEAVVVEGLAYEFLAAQVVQAGQGTVPLKPNEKAVRELISALSPLVHIPVTGATIIWLDADERERPPIDRCVFLTNGTLATDWWMAGRPDALITPTPALFILRVLPVTFDPAATAVRWERFISEIFEGDVDRMVALQVLFGYWMLPATWLQAIVYLVGLPGSGKGTLTQVLQRLFGLACANPSLETLGDKFGLMGLVGCQLAILTDVHDVGRNSAGAHERLLKISGEDPVDVERKHVGPLLSVHLPVRFVLVMNELVPLPDVSGAMERRTVILPFRTSFDNQAEANLVSTLIATEASGILNWALVGLRQLYDIRQCAEEEDRSTKVAVLSMLRTSAASPEYDLLADLSNPMRVFVRERCTMDPTSWMSTDDLFDEWNSWNNNRFSRGSRKIEVVSQLISTAKGGVHSSQRTDAYGNRVRALDGIRLTRGGLTMPAPVESTTVVPPVTP